jgi:hypothetical protein
MNEGDKGMGSEQIELIHNNFEAIYHSLPDRVKRPELLCHDVLDLVFELGRFDVIGQQLCARATALEVKDAATYEEAETILTEASTMRRECEQKCDALFADFELFEKFYNFCTELGTILDEKIEAWERRDKRRKLTSEQVLEMHRDYDTGKVSMRQLAKRFNVSVSTVSNIINRRYWKD